MRYLTITDWQLEQGKKPFTTWKELERYMEVKKEALQKIRRRKYDRQYNFRNRDKINARNRLRYLVNSKRFITFLHVLHLVLTPTSIQS